MQWRAEFHASPDDFALLQRDHRRDNLDSCFRPHADAYQFLKCPVILRPAVRVSGTVLFDDADVDSLRANGFSPTHRHGKKMRVSKPHLGHAKYAVRPANTSLI